MWRKAIVHVEPRHVLFTFDSLGFLFICSAQVELRALG